MAKIEVRESSDRLAKHLEQIGIITLNEVLGFWEGIIFQTIINETKSISFRLSNYMINLSTLSKGERDIEEENLPKLIKLVETVLLGLDQEQDLSGADILFRGEVIKMRQIIEAFIKGKTRMENPALYINKAYQAGIKYRKVLEPERMNDE